ncbi:MAG TPA: AMP-binding protein [Alphaproteobacteria bacterium]
MDDVPAIFEVLRRKTAPLLLVEHARAKPDAVAFRSKHLGLYRERTWRDYAMLVGRCAQGLRALGVQRGERVAIMGDACEEWMICDLAAQALGAITYGVYPTASMAEVEYQLTDGGASLFIAEDQEYVDRLLPIVDRLPGLRWIVVIDASAMFGYDHPKLKPLAELLDAGGDDGEASLAALEDMARAIGPADPAFIVYTSGTTGHPKGALITHGKHLAGTYTIVDLYPTLADKDHRAVVFLPLCHVFGRDVAITLPLISRLVPHFGEDIEDLPQTLFEVAPTVLFTVPRYMQKFASQVLVGLGSTSWIKRAAYDLAMRLGRICARRRWAGRHGMTEALLNAAARAIAFGPMLNKLGLDRVELAISGGAPLPPDTAALWQIWGVNLVNAYGQTETGGAFISGQTERFAKPGNVGTVPRGWEVTLAANGEVLVRGPDYFEGYWRQPDATREVIDEQGWQHTGDVGEWDNGCLRLVDRVRDFMVTAGGKTISPSFIENILRASPYVAEVIVFGHGRKYLTALVEIDYDTVAEWARSQDIAYTGFTSLAASPPVTGLIQAEIDRANRQLARVEQIKAFRILPKQLDPEEEGEPVTPTRKVKRNLMYDRFEALVESMYDAAEERLVASAAGDVLQVPAS